VASHRRRQQQQTFSFNVAFLPGAHLACCAAGSSAHRQTSARRKRSLEFEPLGALGLQLLPLTFDLRLHSSGRLRNKRKPFLHASPALSTVDSSTPQLPLDPARPSARDARALGDTLCGKQTVLNTTGMRRLGRDRRTTRKWGYRNLPGNRRDSLLPVPFSRH